ncbi:hypothetical protein F66182_9387 [Fusarium sp. NRRL 66182]|nr:hypothetical protein F66182_9387 [Fusarium sp. NRRL 66182]
MEASLSYHEPSITVISILSGFLLLLNLVNHGLDRIAYCGLIGQIALGIAWATPGAKWLSRDIENAVMALGYIGLILIVFEGGLSTSFKSLMANIGLSSAVAATGIILPIGLSFATMSMLNAAPLQAFAAGAALCSTSLGTTFTILGTSGLSSTRLGVVLTSAAMMDDVVGLIMVQVISNLGGGDSFDAATVVRPVMVSLAFAIVVPVLCKFIVAPFTIRLNSLREANPSAKVSKLLGLRQIAFAIHTAYLLGIVIGATFAGTSSLLAAYIAGATISWWDSEVPHLQVQPSASQSSASTEAANTRNSTAEAISTLEPSMEGGSGLEIYHHYYEAAVEPDTIHASVGFSIPITKLFSGPIVWRGLIYTVLMTIAKLACGLWLISFTEPFRGFAQLIHKFTPKLKRNPKVLVPGAQCTDNPSSSASPDRDGTIQQTEAHDAVSLGPLGDADAPQSSPQMRNSTPKPENPLSLYPACIVGIGMVARGEIGYLISALAESRGIFGRPSNGQPSELFLIVTWAITLCTVIGPISVGLVVSRVRQLESGSRTARGEGKRNVLGAWGVS